MIRRFFQSVICICLSPLLIADSLAQPIHQEPQYTASSPAKPSGLASSDMLAVTRNTVIELIGLEDISSAMGKSGTKIHFRVTRDVAVHGIFLVQARTIITGTIKSVTRASKKHHRDGYIKLRLDGIKLRSGKTLRLTGLSPQEQIAKYEDRKTMVRLLLTFPLWAPMLPWIVLMAIGMWDEGGTPDGYDVRLEKCFRVTAYTAAEHNVRIADLPGVSALVDQSDASVCPPTWGIPIVDAYHFKVE